MNEFQKFLVGLNEILKTVDESLKEKSSVNEIFALEVMRSTIKLIIIAAEDATKKDYIQ